MPKEVSTIFRSAVWGGEASLAVLDTSALTAEIAMRHRFSRWEAAAIGRVATVTAYLCSWIEENERLSVTVEGGGALGKVHVFGDGALRLCGAAGNAARTDGKKSVEELIGRKGCLTVTRDGGRGLPFSGTCALESGNITIDAEAYLATSEQRPTAISLFEEIKADSLLCGGIFIQPLTGAPPTTLARAREALAHCKGASAKEILAFFGAENAEKREITFGCTCSREKAERAVLSAGRECAEAVLSQEGAVNVHCHECNTDYTFTEEDLRALFER